MSQALRAFAIKPDQNVGKDDVERRNSREVAVGVHAKSDPTGPRCLPGRLIVFLTNAAPWKLRKLCAVGVWVTLNEQEWVILGTAEAYSDGRSDASGSLD